MQYKRMKLNKKFDDQSKNKNQRIFLKELPFHFTFIFGSLIFFIFHKQPDLFFKSRTTKMLDVF